jgi:aryl-alcohol dehydrogenase-like predicted oxidoreductase
VPFEKTAETMARLKQAGKIRCCAVSNYSPEQMDAFSSVTPVQLAQPPYNLFERGIEKDVLPYCNQRNIVLMAYGALCRGLLSGTMTRERQFEGDDLRKWDPKFRKPRFDQYLAAAQKIEKLAREHFDRSLLAASVRWMLDMNVEIAIWGGRRPEQMAPIDEIMGWQVTDTFKQGVDQALAEISVPIGPQFMAPGARD